MDINYISLNNFKSADLIDGVVIYPLKRARRGKIDPRGYLVEMYRSDWKELKSDTNPPAMTYSSFTYKDIARDEDQWHIHPDLDVSGGIEQIDRWAFIGKAIAVIGDPVTKKLNLFKIGTGWGDEGFFCLLIPTKMYHGFLSAGGVIDDEGKEGVWILNWPDKLYDYENPGLIEGRVPHKGSLIYLPDGREFNWRIIKDDLKLNE